MRVAMATNSLFRSDGIGNVALQVGERLVKSGHELHLVYPMREYDRPRLDDWAAIATGLVPVPEIVLRAKNLRRTSLGIASAAASVRRLRPDVFYVHQPSHTALGAAICLGVETKQVLHLHGHPPSRLGRATRFGTRRCDAIAFVSESVRRAWEPHLTSRSKKFVVYNGVDLERFRPATQEERADVRRAFGLPQGGPIVGFFGRCTPAKGVFTLADAFRELCESVPEAWLVIAGATPDESVRSELARRLSGLNTMFVGDLADPSEMMRAIDCAAVPSEMEAFPLVVLELMASGVPVVGSDVGGIPEALGPSLAHQLVPVGDPNTLASKIRQTIERAATEEQHNLFRTRAEEFSLEQSTNAIVDVLYSTVRR